MIVEVRAPGQRKWLRTVVAAVSVALLLLIGETTLISQPAPLTFETTVSAGRDDAEEAVSGAVSLSSTDLELVLDGSDQTVGLRFVGVEIPAGARIVTAWVQFRTDEVSAGAVNLLIRGEASDNPTFFATAARNVSSRPRTAASVGWSPNPWTVVNEMGSEQRTPDLAAVVQEIVDRSGWAAGNALALLITGTGRRTADSFEGGLGPLLHVEYETGGPVNQAPSVNAGPDQVVVFPSPVTLSGAASDDGLPAPPGSLATLWTQQSGPGTVTFTDPTSVSTTAGFSTAGTYVLRLTAADSALEAYDETTITVGGPVNQAPSVNAGPDQVVVFPSPVSLGGAASDDGLPAPPGTLATLWTQRSGPGTVTFTDPTSVSTTAGFSTAGTYVLRLTADDSALEAYDETTITAGGKQLPGFVRDEDAGVSPETQGYLGPFMDGNGNLYTVVESDLASLNQPAMFKSTDGGSTWSEVDAASRPPRIGDLEGAWMAQEGTMLHLVYQDSGGNLGYATFGTSDASLNPDTWQIKEADIFTATETVQGCVIVPLTNGDVWAIWHDTDGAGYAKRSGGIWGSASSLADATRGLTAVRGASNLVHIFYNNSNDEIQHRSLSADGLLSGPERVDDQGGHAVFRSMTNPAYYDDDGDEVITIVWADASGYLSAARVINDGTPAAEELVQSTAVLINPVYGNVALVAALGVDRFTKTVYALWADSLTRDVFLNKSVDSGSWSTEIEIADEVTADWIHGASIFTHSAFNGGFTALGYLIDNNADADELTFDIEYREHDPN